LPDGQVDAHDSPSLGRIGVAGNGHIEAIPPALRRDESASPQKGLQVVKEAWSVEEDVHAASRALRELPQRRRLLSLWSESRSRQEVRVVESSPGTLGGGLKGISYLRKFLRYAASIDSTSSHACSQRRHTSAQTRQCSW
jgi:hypothetical protein